MRELERLSAGMYGISCAEYGEFVVGKIIMGWFHLPFRILQGLLSTIHPHPPPGLYTIHLGQVESCCAHDVMFVADVLTACASCKRISLTSEWLTHRDTVQ